MRLQIPRSPLKNALSLTFMFFISSLITGLIGLAAACGIGAYKFKHRGTMSTSVFLMQLRVAAQGTVVACLTAGIGYHMAEEYLFNKPEPSPKKE